MFGNIGRLRAIRPFNWLLFLYPIFLPLFIYDNLYDSFMSSKIVIFQLFSFMLSVLCLYELKQKNYLVSFRNTYWFIGLATLFVVFLWRNDFHDFFWHLSTRLHILVTIFLVSNVLSDQQKFSESLLLTSLGTAVGVIALTWHILTIRLGLLTFPRGYTDISLLPSFFGQQNLLAAYIAFGFPFLVWGWQRQSSNLKCLYGSALLFSLLLVAFSCCRSAVLSILVTIFLFGQNHVQKYWRRWMAAGSFFFLLGSVGLWYLRHSVPALLLTKWQNIVHRLEIGIASLNMLKSFPWGVGPGQFADSHGAFLHLARYGDFRSYHHPHNEWLAFACEHGLFWFALWSGLISMLIIYWHRKIPSSSAKTLVFALISTLCIESMLQFPLDTGSGLWTLILIFSFIIANLKDSKPKTCSKGLAVALLIGVCFLQPGLWSKTYAYYLAGRNPYDLSKLQKACKIHQSDARICFRSADLAIILQKTEIVCSICKDLLSKNPSHQTALLIMLKLFADKGKWLKVMRLWRVFSLRQQALFVMHLQSMNLPPSR